MPEVIGDRFECLEEIGRGADSIVYCGLDKVTGNNVAVKILPADPSRGFADIQREINARKQCESVHIVPIIAWGMIDSEEGRRHYIVTPLLEGETLEVHLERGVLQEDEAVRIVGEVAGALEPIHKSGFLHGDLKPANIFYTDKNELRLLDFGLSRGFHHIGASGGTACYVSPEQLLGQPCDARADLYALGCIFHELVTGRPPFTSDDIAEVLFDQVNTTPDPPVQHRTDLSGFINAIILVLLEKSPDKRFQSATELTQALEGGETGPWWSEKIAASTEEPGKSRRNWQPSRSWQIPLVGRKTELDHLYGLVAKALDHDAGCFIVIGGAAGIGKTRLVEETLSRFGSDAYILTSRCILFDTRVPYLPLIGLVEDLMRREEFDPSQPARFQRFLTRQLPQTPLLVPKFMEFLTKQAQVESGRGALTTDNLLYLFTQLFIHLSTESPLILFIDDLHWSEPSTCNYLKYFARNIVDVPLVLIGAYRPEDLVTKGESESSPSGLLRDLAMEPNFETIDLASLNAKESQEFVGKACGPMVGNELAPILHSKTEGNPCYLKESIALLREQNVIIGEGTNSRVASSISEISIPATVADLLKSRLARLDLADRELLEIASIQGPSFKSDLLLQEDDTDKLALLRRLSGIERQHRIIESRESGYAFDHHLLYEYVYQSIAPDLRTAYHLQLARNLEKLEGEDAVYTLADHYSRGGDDEKASEFLLKAARLSMAKYSGAEALETLDRAREHYSRLPGSHKSPEREWEFACVQVEIASHLGDNSREEAALDEMVVLADSFGSEPKTLDVVELKAKFALRVSRFDDALTGFNEACGIAGKLNDTHRVAELTHKIGTTYREMLHWDEAMDYLEKALEPAREAGDEHLVGCILKDIGTVKTKQSKWREASEDYTRALPLLRKAGDRREEAFGLNGLAVSLFCAGDQDAALERWEEANRIFESIGYPSGQSNILHNLGVTYSNLGQMDRSIECLKTALRLRQSIGMRHAQVSTLNRLGFVHFVIGAFDIAAEHLRSALAIAREIGEFLGCIEIYYHFAEIAIAQGELDAAGDHIRLAWDSLGKDRDEYHTAHLELAEAMLALGRGNWTEASKHLSVAERTNAKDPQLIAELYIHHAWALQGEGMSDEADNYIEKYQDTAHDCPFIYARITGQVILHKIYGLRKDNEKQIQILETIRRNLDLMDKGTTDPVLRKGFTDRWGSYL